MPAYNILSIRTADDDDVMYPALDQKLLPILEPPDGINVPERLPSIGLNVYHTIDGSLRKLSGAVNISAEGLFTDQRMIVHCKNYDVVRWSGSNDISAAIFGAGTETAFHLGEKALHRLKARGKAMVGHVYYPWIRSVAWQPHRGRKHPGALRAGITNKLEDGNTKNLYLSLALDRRLDPGRLAQDLVQRVATWWLANGADGLKENALQSLEHLRNAEVLPPPPAGRVSVYQLPVYRLPLPKTVPIEMANSTRRQAAGHAESTAPAHTASALRPDCS